MKNFINLLNDIKNRQFKITIDKNNKAKLQQTQRNALKAELMNAVMQDLQENYNYVFNARNETKNLIGIEIENQSIADNLPSESDGSGAITAFIDISIGDLDIDLSRLANEYTQRINEKQEKAKENAKKKAAKIERDKKTRAEKQKIKDEGV